MKRYRAVIERDAEDPAGAWLVDVPAISGAHTYGRSLAEAKRNAQEVVELWTELAPGQFAIQWDVQLGSLAGSVDEARTAIAHARTGAGGMRPCER